MKNTAENRSQLVKIIAGAGLLVGSLDIVDAFILHGLHGISPVRILQGIAIGVAALILCIGIPLTLIASRYSLQSRI
jgi:hypothetical protein